MEDWASPSQMMLRLDQYEGVIAKRSELFLEVFVNYLLRQGTARGFESYGRRLALIAKRDEGEDQEERLRAVPEATRSGDVIYYTLDNGTTTRRNGNILLLPIVLRPCGDEISAAEDIDIVKKLRDKGCNFLGNDILHGRFVGICSNLEYWSRKANEQVLVLH
jgi:hypothetical protein